MNTKQMEYVLELSRTLNFNHAAENMYISQSTMTYQIKMLEEEIGFQIFNRSKQGVSLTPAGFQFCVTLRNIQNELKNAIEQGQNFSQKYRDDIRIGLPMRSAIHRLPQAIIEFSNLYPDVSITPKFAEEASIEAFLNHEVDLVFALQEDVHRIPDIHIDSLYTSGFYLITQKEDILAKKEKISLQDLEGRTLMIGGGSPPKLRSLQQKIIRTIDVSYFNSQNHETTLTNVAANRGVCIAPGFLNDYTDTFAWTPVDVPESFSCVLCRHTSDTRPSLQAFISILTKLYT